jgi:hypothetical protein
VGRPDQAENTTGHASPSPPGSVDPDTNNASSRDAGGEFSHARLTPAFLAAAIGHAQKDAEAKSDAVEIRRKSRLSSRFLFPAYQTKL